MNKQQKNTNVSIIGKQAEGTSNLASVLKSIKKTLPDNGSISIKFSTVSFESKTPSATAEETNIPDQNLPASKATIDITAKHITSSLDEHPQKFVTTFSSPSYYQYNINNNLLYAQPTSKFINDRFDGYGMPLKNVIDLNSVEQSSLLLRHITNEVILYGDNVKYCKDIDFIEKTKFANTPSPTIQDYQVVPQRLALGDLKPPRIENELDESIMPGNLTLILGPSNVGKSYVALEIARTMICGGSAFSLRSAGGKKVYYLDGEQNMTRTKRRLCQLCGEDLQSQKQVENAFLYNKIYSDTLHGPDASTVLADAAAKCGCDVVVVDNLISSCQSANSSKIIEFVQTLGKKGMGVIMTHYSENIGQVFLGPTELGEFSKNIFKLMSVDPAGWPGNEKILDAISAKGPLVCMTLEKTKDLPRAQGNFVVAHLPIDGQWKVLEGEFQPAGKELASHNKPLDMVQSGNGPQHDLSPDENKVLEVLNGKSANRSALQKATKLGETKVLDILGSLIEKELIVKEGSGKATYYRIR